jgi:hypothetical protein
MNIPVLLEQVENNGYRATSGPPLALSAEGDTRDEALAKLRQLMAGRLRQGTELVSLDVQPADNPWLAIAGTLDPNDPDVQDWERAMEEYRREVDNDPNYP